MQIKQKQMEKNILKLPPIGLRIIKSAIAVALCYVVQIFRGDNGIVFYSQLSALWCMQAYISTTKQNAMQRIIGTIVGAVFGLAVLLIAIFVRTRFDLGEWFSYTFNALLISATLIPVLWTTVVLKKKTGFLFFLRSFPQYCSNSSFRPESLSFYTEPLFRHNDRNRNWCWSKSFPPSTQKEHRNFVHFWSG